MKFLKLNLLVLFALLNFLGFSQSEIENLVREGIQYHDNGNYEKAIETYTKALKIEPNSSMVNYEISYSYFANGDYKKAIKHADKVIKNNQKNVLEAYITKGNSLDMLGKTKKSIALFEDAIKNMERNHLLYYNLGLNYFKISDLKNAEVNVIKAIETKPNHSSSHLMLAYIHDARENPVQTLLASHFFLLLEPSTSRSIQAYKLIQKNFGGNVSQDKEDPNSININISSDMDSDFGAAELMISMLEASKNLEENEGKTEDELFIENTKSFFSVMGELNKEDKKDIWWTFYTPFFYEMAQSKHMETYCKYITQASNEKSQEWLSENEEKLKEWDEWMSAE